VDSEAQDKFNVPVIVMRDSVAFPAVPTVLAIGRDKSVRALEIAAQSEDKLVALFMQKDVSKADLGVMDLHQIGTIVRVKKVIQHKNTFNVEVDGLHRVGVEKWVSSEPYFQAKLQICTEIPPPEDIKPEIQKAKSLVQKFFRMDPDLTFDLGGIVNLINDPSPLADIISSTLPLDGPKQQAILETLDVSARMKLTLEYLHEAIALSEVDKKVDSRTKESIVKGQREYYLREKLRSIRQELGEDEGEDEDDDAQYKDKILLSEMTGEVEKTALKEVRRLRKMLPQSSESAVVRTYLDWMLDLPWHKSSKDNLDLEHVRKILDEDHYGMGKIKDRIIEYLAVCKLKKDLKGPILCLVGPPGTGKTSLAKSIARALGRETVRISLGGVRDEAEMRGHRRTYIGAMPGQIIKGYKKAGTNNPVVVLDEIDKLGSDFRGDPAGALLEILDPEQNDTFKDHYLDIPFDLSKTIFICTANSLQTIRKPLLDRLEILEVSGYTVLEKVRIAQEHIVNEQLEGHGITEAHVELPEEVLTYLIESYTREAGVRSLKREIGSLFRSVAKKVALLPEGGKFKKQVLSQEEVTEIRGPIKYTNDVAERTSVSGVVTGMAWTASGGDILFIEATKMPGTGKLKISGNLGDVMKESIGVAQSFVRSIAEDLGIPKEVFKEHDIHVHVPAGGTPKDGPSAGVTMLTAIVSLLTGIPVNHELAMTGEASLRGAVLPVGGIKEKVMAAHRAGVRTVVLPEKNQKDWPELPETIREDMTVHFASRMEDVLHIVLGKDALEAFKKRQTEETD
jgi:ATP-dependent Lon protease